MAVIFVGIFNLIGVFTSVFLVDKLGRRTLLLISYSSLFASFIIMGTYFIIQSNDASLVKNLGFIPIAALCLYVFMNDMGAISCTFVIMGEIFSQGVKDIGAGVAMTTDYVFGMSTGLLFPFCTENLGFGATFFIFSAFHAIFFTFVLFKVPETKGKTFLEIQDILLMSKKK